MSLIMTEYTGHRQRLSSWWLFVLKQLAPQITLLFKSN